MNPPQQRNWTIKQDDFMVDVGIGHGLTLQLTRSTDGTFAFHGFGIDGRNGVGFPSDYVIDGSPLPDECEFVKWLRTWLPEELAR